MVHLLGVVGPRLPQDLVKDVGGPRLIPTNSPNFVVDDPSKESGVENNSTTSVTAGDQSRFIYDYKKDRESMLQTYYYTRRYYAYRKGLLKLDISQLNKDPKKAVECLKSSTGWSELLNVELRRGLKSHMDSLKGLDMSNMNQGFTSESENVALERTNVEMASTLEKKIKSFDLTVRMNHFYTHTSLRNLARVCSIQAQETEVVLVKQALPVRDICKEQIISTGPEAVMSASLRQTVLKFHETDDEAVSQGLHGLPASGTSEIWKGCCSSHGVALYNSFCNVCNSCHV